MKNVSVIIAALVCAACALAQPAQPNEFGVVLAAYQAGGSPAFTGAGVWAKQFAPAAAPKTYSFTEYDVVPRTWRPFVLNSMLRTGVYQEVFQWGNLRAGSCRAVDPDGRVRRRQRVCRTPACGAAIEAEGRQRRARSVAGEAVPCVEGRGAGRNQR